MTQGAPKFKQRPRTRNEITPVGCGLAVFMLIAGLIIGGLVAFILTPSLINLDVTRTALAVDRANLQMTSNALAGDAQSQQALATERAFYAQSTEVQLQQTRSFIENMIQATQTANVAISYDQLTQAQFNFENTLRDADATSTQAMINLSLTQAAIFTPSPPQ